MSSTSVPADSAGPSVSKDPAPQRLTVGVVGNPNCGKTTLFNALTGTRQRVGNWPGVTVEKKTGYYRYNDVEIELVDLPGTYSLEIADNDVAIDEQIARQYVDARQADLIVNIVDAANLERNLYLTTQLLEMKVPVLVALNMLDVAAERGVSVDMAGLAESLDCPVVGVVAASGKGVDQLRQAILDTAAADRVSAVAIEYPAEVEAAVTQIEPDLTAHLRKGVSGRWLALRLLEGDFLARNSVDSTFGQSIAVISGDLEQRLGDDIDIVIADARYNLVNKIAQKHVKRSGEVTRHRSDLIDQVVLNRYLGIPVFLLMMYLMFMFTINIGGAFIDFFDLAAGTLFVDGLGVLLASLGLPDWLIVLLADGAGGGVQVVATFIPVIGFLFLFLSVLEDSGYMARAAFVMDRAMRAIGLPGKAFVPLLVGFGCNVPAIMATRTMEQERDRLMTITMTPFMSCGARLPIYALFAAAFFPVGGQNLVFALYLIGIAMAVLTGLVMKSTLLQGKSSPFVLELPPYHLPTLKGVALRTWDRLKGFIVRAGQLIVPMVLVLNFLNAVGNDGSFGNEDSTNSVLSEIGRTIAPAFAPMGLDRENWPAAVGIFTGVLAKEAVVGTLDSLYGTLAEQELAAAGVVSADEPFSLVTGLEEALNTIPDNLLAVVDSVADPLGINIGNFADVQTAAAEQEVQMGTFGAMVARFDGKAGAFAYLLFVLLYFPCVAATAAIYREAGIRWAAFVVGWTTGLGYVSATVFYQLANFGRHPATSLAWVVGLSVLTLVVVLGLRRATHRAVSAITVTGEA